MRIARIIFYCILAGIAEIYLFLEAVDRSADLGLFFFVNGRSSINVDTRFFVLSAAVLAVLLVFLYISHILNIVEISIYINNKNAGRAAGALYTALVLAMIAICAFMAHRHTKYIYDSEEKLHEMRAFVDREKTVVHACGRISDGEKKYTYTNSWEALQNFYAAGNRITEVDFMMSADNKLLCAHNGEDVWAHGIDSEEPLTQSEFLSRRFRGVFSTMSMDMLADFMRQHQDLYIVTDIKDNNIEACRWIADNCGDLSDRIIVQIYHISEYDGIRSLGFDNIIFTLYRTSEEERQAKVLLDNTRRCDLLGITFWESGVEDETLYSALKETGVPLFIHTVNNRDDIRKYIDDGLLIYTDNTDNDWMR